MSDAQSYHDGLIAQGYSPEQALQFTQQHFPDFTGMAPAAPAMSAPQPAAPAAYDPAPVATAPAVAAAPVGGGMLAPAMGGAPVAGSMADMVSSHTSSGSGSSAIGYVAVACIVAAIALSTWGVFGYEWLIVEKMDGEEPPDGMSMTVGLNAMQMEQDLPKVFGDAWDSSGMSCSDYKKSIESVTEEDGDSDLVVLECDGDIFTMTMHYDKEQCEEEENQSDKDDCEATQNAGMTGTIILWTSIGTGVAATILILFNVLGVDALPVNTQKFGMIAGIAAGALAIIAVLAWWIMMPSTDTDVSAGMNVWFTIVGGVLGVAAGILTKTHGNSTE